MNETTRRMVEEQEAKHRAAVRDAQVAYGAAEVYGEPIVGATCANAKEAVPGFSLTPQIVRDCRQRQRELVAQRDRIENSLRIVQELLNVWES